MQIVSANTIYSYIYIPSILLSHRIEVAFAYMIKYLSVPLQVDRKRERGREEESDGEFILPELTRDRETVRESKEQAEDYLVVLLSIRARRHRCRQGQRHRHQFTCNSKCRGAIKRGPREGTVTLASRQTKQAKSKRRKTRSKGS